jgi:heptosyltransferase-2
MTNDGTAPDLSRLALQFPAEFATILLAGMQDTLSKTLIIRFSSVGDIILSSPLVRALHRTFPDMHLDYLVKDEYADLVRHLPHVDRVIPFTSRRGFAELLAVRRLVKSGGYDAVLDIHDSVRSRFICFGIPRVTRINKRKFARYALIHWKRNWYATFGGAPDVSARYIETASRYGVRDDGDPAAFEVPAEAVREARLRLDGITTPAVGICPAARHATKIWPAQKYAEAARALAARTGSAVLLFGSADEIRLCNSIRGMITKIDPSIDVRNLAGATTLAQTAALMDACGIILTNDTGLMHLATTRRKPVVAIFGSTVREFGFFPRGESSAVVERTDLACRPCTHIGLAECPLKHFRCMNDLSVEDVTQAAYKLLGLHA